MLYVLPARDTVIFPGVLAPLFVGRPSSLKAIEMAAVGEERLIFVAAQKDPLVEEPRGDDLYEVGTVCVLLQMIRMPGGSVKLLLEGKERKRSRQYAEKDSVLMADLVPVSAGYTDTPRIEALRRQVISGFEDYVNLHPRLPSELAEAVKSTKDAGLVADMVASHMLIEVSKKQSLLECFNTQSRLELLYKYLMTEWHLLSLGREIHNKVQSELDHNQKEYYLREQLKVIQEELEIDASPETEELRERAEYADLPDIVREKIETELKRMSKMPPMSPELTVSRTYVEWLLDIPWFRHAKERLNMAAVQKKLDANHYGLEKVKDRLIELLAVRKMAGKSARAQILCLAGPPGVGKTSLGQSIAQALGRPFVSFSLGGMRDEAEIRGHRRTYIGALPGRIVQKLKQAGCCNPVLLMDEVDKIGSDFRGDPASALLEVLDPEQNAHFTDHYLEVPLDLSDVLFITTANVLHSIPKPLLDRMEVLELPGYLPEEKLHIAQKHLLPRIYKETGLTKRQVSISTSAVKSVIDDYTRESGVRELDRKLSALLRKAARVILEKTEAGDVAEKITVGPKDLPQWLGAPHRPDVRIPLQPEKGVSVGLAWTAAGGDVLVIEAVAMRGKGDVALTGNLGSVMKESAQTAMGFLRSHWSQLTDKEEPNWDETSIHLHVPEGAIPKDGPSAGITMAVALFSALSGALFAPGHAMTGELSLRGDVLPIGGLREKILAAKRAGISTIFVPAANAPDIEDIEPWIKENVQFVYVRKASEVFSRIFAPEDGKNA
ncbi:MAG: endopeptidase La [Pyramidobacter sp.]|nr:endopeptidase La [Pyramidobacter sp.]